MADFANMRIITAEVIDVAALASTPACVANAPITNLQIGLRSYVARVAGGSWVIDGTLAASATISGLCLYKHNFSTAATVTLKLYDALGALLSTDTIPPTGTPKSWGIETLGFAMFAAGGWGIGTDAWGVAVMTDWPVNYLALWLATQRAGVKSFKITITDAAHAGDYLELGRIYIGAYWSPAANISWGLKMAWREQTRQFRSDGQSLRSEGYPPYRAFSANMEELPKDERAEWANLCRKVGMRKDFYLSVYPGEGGELEKDYSSAVKLTAMPEITANRFNNFITDAQLEEV